MAREFLKPSGLKVTLVHSYVSAIFDEAAAKYFVPDFIKIDIEGAEALVLRGANATLSQKRPAMIIETHGAEAEAECMLLLAKTGYTPSVVERSRGLFSESRGVGYNRWLVCY